MKSFPECTVYDVAFKSIFEYYEIDEVDYKEIVKKFNSNMHLKNIKNSKKKIDDDADVDNEHDEELSEQEEEIGNYNADNDDKSEDGDLEEDEYEENDESQEDDIIPQSVAAIGVKKRKEIIASSEEPSRKSPRKKINNSYFKDFVQWMYYHDEREYGD